MLTLTVPDNCKVEISRGDGGRWVAGINMEDPVFPIYFPSDFWQENEPMMIDEWEGETIMHVDESYSMCIDEE